MITWRPGEVILNQYEVRGLLGEGGMGRVYEVLHQGWNLPLAVKSPRPELVASIDSFVTEAEAWVKLGLHPHVVTCFYVRTIDEVPHVFAECVDGGSLSAWIRNRRLYAGGTQAALARIVDVAVQLAWGLAHAHGKTFVHQDIKPANVMMTPDGIAKITDFGLARAAPRRDATTMSPASLRGAPSVARVGLTPAYASPEQSAQERVTSASDVWSWGVSVLEMFAGQVTWLSGIAAPDVLASLVEDGPPSDDCPAVPSAMSDVLRRCFYDDPSRRPTANDLATTLIEAFPALTGYAYDRETPESGALVASSLNNRAISMLDLGRDEEGRALLAEALGVDASHREAKYNAALIAWRGGEIDKDEAARRADPTLRPAIEREAGLDGPTDLVPRLGAAPRTTWFDAKDVVSFVMANQGPFLATAGKNGALALHHHAVLRLNWLWSGSLRAQRIWEVNAFRGGVPLLAFSPDDRFVMTTGNDGLVHKWSTADGSHAGAIEVGAGAQQIACCGSTLAVLFAARLATFDLHTGKREADYVTPPEARSLFCHAAGSTLAVISKNDVLVFSLPMLRSLATLHVEGTLAHAVFVGDEIATCDDAGIIRYWDVSTAQCVDTWASHEGAVKEMASMPGGNLLVLRHSTDISVIRARRQKLGKVMTPYRLLLDFIDSLGLSANGLLVYKATQQLPRDWKGPSSNTIHFVDLAPTSRLSLHSGLRVEYAARKAEYALARPRAADELGRERRAFTNYLQEAIDAADRGDIEHARAEFEKARAQPGYERSPELMSASRRVLSVAARGKLREQWVEHTFPGEKVEAVALSGNGAFVLGGTRDGAILWQLDTRTVVRDITNHQHPVYALALSFDGGTFATGDLAGKLLVHCQGQEAPLFEFRRESAIQGVYLTSDGSICVAAFKDGVILRVRVRDGVTTWADAAPKLYHLAVSRDARRAVSANWRSKMLLVHDLVNGKTIDAIHLPWDCCDLRFAPDDRHIFVAMSEYIARVDLTTTEIVDLCTSKLRRLCVVAAGPMLTSSSEKEQTFLDWTPRGFVELGRFGAPLAEAITDSVAASADMTVIATINTQYRVTVHRVEWNVVSRTESRVEDIDPWLSSFVEGTAKEGSPWSPSPVEIDRLVSELRASGFGWIPRDAVMERLRWMAASWPPQPPPVRWRPPSLARRILEAKKVRVPGFIFGLLALCMSSGLLLEAIMKPSVLGVLDILWEIVIGLAVGIFGLRAVLGSVEE